MLILRKTKVMLARLKQKVLANGTSSNNNECSVRYESEITFDTSAVAEAQHINYVLSSIIKYTAYGYISLGLVTGACTKKFSFFKGLNIIIFFLNTVPGIEA